MAKAKKLGHVPKKAAPAASVSAPRKPKNVILLASTFVLLTLILLTYAYSMTSEYVFNDTLNYSLVNALKERSTFWTNLVVHGFAAPLSEPWVRATYAWDVSSFGFAPGWSHAVNICLHVLSCIYLYLFTFQLAWKLSTEGDSKIDPYYFSIASTAIWALHPLATGSVAYVSGREGVLGAVNYFLALNFFLFGFYSQRIGRAMAAYAIFFLFAAIGIISNPQCLTLPFFAAGLILLLKTNDYSMKEWLGERAAEVIALLFVGICACYLLKAGATPGLDSGFGLTQLGPSIYWPTQYKMILMYYLRCALLPFGLSVYPPYVATAGFADPGTIGGVVSVIAIVAAGFIQKQPLIRIGVLLFVLTLFPWLILPQGEISADSRFYLPLAGLCMVAGVGLAHLAVKDFRKTAVGFGVLLLALISLTVWREAEWSTNKRLWRAETKRNPASARAHAYRAADSLDRNKPTDCKAELTKALALNNDDFIAHIINGYYFYRLKDFKQASAELQSALALGTRYKVSEAELAPYRAQLARALALNGDLPGAYAQSTLASKHITTDSFLYLLNGKALLDQHQELRALKVLEDGVKLDPTNADFLIPIAQAALDCGVPQVRQHAYAASAKAMQVRPGLTTSKLYIRACLEMGRPQEALPRLELLRKTDPKDAEIVWLAYAYAKHAGKADEAEKLRKQALAMEPGIDKRVKLHLRGDQAPVPGPGGGQTAVPEGAASLSAPAVVPQAATTQDKASGAAH
ncbi:MAG: tetratricopeptide repeat protein [Cyanobacteria bacterium SZAS-4]|nr:tetratricopeptide repeat protein [Cyanobacteria bacterium SZAS-4]